jgi:hypothetical protein
MLGERLLIRPGSGARSTACRPWKVWFDEAITCRSRAEIGIPATPDESFILDDAESIASVQQAHREACAASRLAAASLALDDLVHGNRRGPLPLRWVYLHMRPALRPRRHPARADRQRLTMPKIRAMRSLPDEPCRPRRHCTLAPPTRR